MKHIIKNILKEEYDTIKLRDFIYNYFDKKIESGEWKWVKNYDTIDLVENKSEYKLLELEKPNTLFVDRDVHYKFISGFSMDWFNFRSIITSYVEDRLNIKDIDTIFW